MSDKTGGPAFPLAAVTTLNGDTDGGWNGMTLRDWFAGQALQGLLANPKLQQAIMDHGGALGGWIESSAFGFADAMIAEREGKE